MGQHFVGVCEQVVSLRVKPAEQGGGFWQSWRTRKEIGYVDRTSNRDGHEPSDQPGP